MHRGAQFNAGRVVPFKHGRNERRSRRSLTFDFIHRRNDPPVATAREASMERRGSLVQKFMAVLLAVCINFSVAAGGIGAAEFSQAEARQR